MPGNKQGGSAAAHTNKARYGEDFYRKIGAKGGVKGKTGGFFANRKLARLAGLKGGLISSRRRNQTAQEKEARRQQALAAYNRLLDDIAAEMEGNPTSA